MLKNSRLAFFLALGLHALAALGMWDYSRELDASHSVVATVMNVNWEVQAETPSVPEAAPQAPAKQVHSSVQAEKKEETLKASAVPDQEASNAAVMGKYLAILRDRLGEAIQLHEPRGSQASQLVLKVAIQSSGQVSHTEIEKTSERPEIDRAVLQAFDSLLPLAPFPADWKTSAPTPETITVRIPVVIRARN
jgi:TonB family protein